MSAIIVNSTESMSRVKVVTVKDSSSQALKVLQKSGVLHIDQSRELDPIEKTAIEKEHREINELYTFVSRVLGFLPQDDTVSLDEDVEVIYTRAFSEVADEVRKIYHKTSKLQEKIEAIDAEIQSMEESNRYLKPLSETDNLKLRDLNYSGKYLSSRVVVMAHDSYGIFMNSADRLITENIAIRVENETVLHLIIDTRNVERVEAIVNSVGGTILNIPSEDITIDTYLSSGSGKLDELTNNKADLSKELADAIGTDLKRLVLLREALGAENDRLSVLEKASEAKYITLIEGWVPQSLIEKATTDIRENIEYAYIDVRDPLPGEEPPVKYNNPKGFRPFQIVVNLFATPKYGEWDPTPIVAYSFAFFFGLMVCDVLYGVGIFFLAKYVLTKFVDDPKAESVKMFQRLLYICSAVGIIGGVLTGQYFANIYEFAGMENFALSIPIRDVLQDPVMFIVLALAIGFIHVNAGHILAFIKAIKEHDKGMIVNKIGLCMIQLGIPALAHGILALEIPGFTEGVYSILTYTMLAGVVTVIIANVISNGGLGAIMWLFDVTGILGDLMSYTRLAGVGLATFYLGSTFNLIANTLIDLMGDSIVLKIIGILVAIVIVAFGHGLNMVLTAIGGFMHSLRLCFVEFLSKFYDGGGVEYSPFKLKKRTEIPLNIKN